VHPVPFLQQRQQVGASGLWPRGTNKSPAPAFGRFFALCRGSGVGAGIVCVGVCVCVCVCVCVLPYFFHNLTPEVIYLKKEIGVSKAKC
jgi:hypothetical protein